MADATVYGVASKVCSGCLIEKPLDAFRKNPRHGSKSGVTSRCKECLNAADREAPHQRGDGYMKAWWLKKKYNLTPEGLAEIRELQGGVCAICGEEPEKDLVIDHDHETGKVRGLLCQHCNLALGHFRDNPSKLRLALEYLARNGRQ